MNQFVVGFGLFMGFDLVRLVKETFHPNMKIQMLFTHLNANGK